MQKDFKITIVILNYNGLSDTLSCLESVFNIDYPNFEVIVVDNKSKICPLEIKKRFPKTILILNQENAGFAEGCNVGIRRALENKADFVLLLNNDTVVERGILKGFLEASLKKPKGGIFGGKILRYSSFATIDHLGGMWSAKKAEFFSLGANDDSNKWKEMQVVDYVCGCLFFIKKEVIEKIGFLEKKFFLLWEETDYCYRAKKAGFEVWTVPEAVIKHKISASFSGGKIHSDYFFWRNRLLWIERNQSTKEKLSLLKVIIPQTFNLCKITAIKSLELFFIKYFKPQKISEKKVLNLLRKKASLRGVLDYFLRKFGPGPSWITNPQNHKLYKVLILKKNESQKKSFFGK